MSRPEKRRAEKAYGKCKQYAKSGFMPKDPDGILDMIFVDPEVDEMLSEEFGWYNRPVIYAFKTSLVPGAIKIGFTFRYHERIEEWREKYPDLEIVGGPWDAFFLMRDTLYFFRDEPVHQNAEGQNHLFRRLAENDFAENVYPSKEFFEVISAKNEKLTKEAIANLVCEVRESILNGGRIYHYFRYDEIKKKVSADKPEKLDNFDANDRQNIAREEAKAAIEAGIVKWLLAAVMRFGKTFTSLMISKDMGAKLTVVLTGKADVRGEWRRAIFHEQLFHKRVFVEFVSGKGANHKVIVSGDYYGNGEFVWKEEVLLSNNFFKNLIDKGYSVVVFGTLQDFSGKKIGSCREIKRKHKELFNMEIDLLIIDETHYGARGTVYGKAIAKTEEDEGNEDQLKAEEKEMLKEHALVEALNAKHQLHLSGTPYRIMTSGEFEADGCRVISTVSYQDQLKDKNDWLRANPDKEESDCPLFGLPTMRMYGIKLTKECREILKRSLEAGNSLSDSISTLFKCDKDGKLIYEQQIRGFLGAFFNGLLKKIHEKNPFVANHLVALLPSVASCHAVADIFKEIVGSNEFNVYVAVQGKVGNTFKRWSEECKDSASLNAALSESEKNGKRTIVFTVNRLMTGTTVPFWDTMLYLRGGENPEPYDQSRFRLASKNVEEYEVDGKILKMCKKNEVLFFDFQVDRMLAIRADAVRSEKKEENAIKEAIDREAKQIVYKNLDTFGDKFKEYEGVDFMKALYEFGNRSFADSMSKYDALADNPNIQKIAERFSGNGFGSKVEKFSPFKGNEGTDIGIEEAPETGGNGPKNGHSGNGEEHSNVSATDIKKRFKNVMLRLHFFVACLRNVFIDNGIDELYEHLAKNEVDRKLLEDEFLLTLDDIATIKENMTSGMKDMFCGECFRVTHYLNSDEYEPIDKVRFISERCAKVSESGVAVPSNIAKKMLEDVLEQLSKGHKSGKILEIGSVYGEYLIEAWKLGDPKLLERLRVLPLNGITGVITKRVCNLLGVSEDIVLTDLIRDEETKMVDIKLFIDDNKNENIKKILKAMKIDATVGNPPYQDGTSSKQIYPKFYELSKELSSVVSLIFPSAWQEPNSNPNGSIKYMYREDVRCDKQIVSLENRTDVFPGVLGAKNVTIVLWMKGYDNKLNGKQRIVSIINGNNVETITDLSNPENIAKNKPEEIIEFADIVTKSSGFKSVKSQISKRRPYDMATDVFKTHEAEFSDTQEGGEKLSVYGGEGRNKRKNLYIARDSKLIKIKRNSAMIDDYKILVPKQWGNMSKGWLGGSFSDIIIASPAEICTEKFQTALPCQDAETIKKCGKYCMTRVFRGLLMSLKTRKGVPNEVFDNIPVQDFHEDFWNSDDINYIDECLFDKYGVPEHIREFLRNNIQPRTIDNIENYHTVK